MKKAIIIGATSGLGNEVARLLLKKGWQLGVAGRRVERLISLQEEFGAERVSVCQLDVTSDESPNALDQLIQSVGLPDMFFYVSGIGFQNPSLDIDVEVTTVRTNCEGMVRLVDHFIHIVRSHPEYYTRQHKAHVAVITSVAGTAALGVAPAYSATKKMQSTYISALAQLARMEKMPVQFTDIKPGFVRTEILNPDKHYPMIMSAKDAASHIVWALERRKRVYVFDWRFRAVVLLWRMIPAFIWERITIVKNG